MNGAADTAPIRVEGELTIYRAAELKDLLLALPPGLGGIEVDLSAVSEIDTAGMQLLMLSRREALAARRGWRLTAHSPAVIEAFELLGLAAHFGDPAVAGASAARTPSAPTDKATHHESGRRPADLHRRMSRTARRHGECAAHAR